MKDTLYIVMPAYNEEANIEEVIREWHPVCERINAENSPSAREGVPEGRGRGSEAYLVIANDGSKDSTYQKMLDLQAKYPYLIPLDKPNGGHGATVLYLYRWAMNRDADGSSAITVSADEPSASQVFIFQTDSDGQTRPDEFWQMWENRYNYDFQIGTRGGRQDGFSRVVVTKTLRQVVWLMFHVWVQDANTPFRLMRADKLQPILDVIPENYNLANVAVSAIAVRWNYNIGWYPITFRPRQGGVNSINMRRIFKIGVQALKDFRTINKNLR